MIYFVAIAVLVYACLSSGIASAQAPGGDARAGLAAYGDWRSDAPGLRRKITVDDLPSPLSQTSVSNPPREVARPMGARLKVPKGFYVEAFATGLKSPRVIRVAPNGDVFVAETEAGRVRVFQKSQSSATPSRSEVFVSGLDAPYGIAFYPPGLDPQFIYIATTRQVLRFRYHSGGIVASDEPEAIVPSLPAGGHTTRDLAFSPDGKRMFVSVGSGSNFGETMGPLKNDELEPFQQTHALGATWLTELERANILAFDPDGGHRQVFATGLRNCSGMTIQREPGTLWCVVNERDELGDDLPPDYATSVKEGAFYGWPWFYIGNHEDTRLERKRPDLANKITVPDILFQPHSAPLGIVFYDGMQFPADYRGDAFVAMHGSWNRAKRTGYKVVRLPFKNGKPTGEYEDFLIGFVADNANVWGKPVDIAIEQDGSMLVTDNVGGIIWRVRYDPQRE